MLTNSYKTADSQGTPDGEIWEKPAVVGGRLGLVEPKITLVCGACGGWMNAPASLSNRRDAPALWPIRCRHQVALHAALQALAEVRKCGMKAGARNRFPPKNSLQSRRIPLIFDTATAASVAQSGRASPCQGERRGFESLRSLQFLTCDTRQTVTNSASQPGKSRRPPSIVRRTWLRRNRTALKT